MLRAKIHTHESATGAPRVQVTVQEPLPWYARQSSSFDVWLYELSACYGSLFISAARSVMWIRMGVHGFISSCVDATRYTYVRLFLIIVARVVHAAELCGQTMMDW